MTTKQNSHPAGKDRKCCGQLANIALNFQASVHEFSNTLINLIDMIAEMRKERAELIFLLDEKDHNDQVDVLLDKVITQFQLVLWPYFENELMKLGHQWAAVEFLSHLYNEASRHHSDALKARDAGLAAARVPIDKYELLMDLAWEELGSSKGWVGALDQLISTHQPRRPDHVAALQYLLEFRELLEMRV